jgi:MFS family permease
VNEHDTKATWLPWLLARIPSGPVAGGYLTERSGWQSIFLINVPLGIIAVVIAPAPHSLNTLAFLVFVGALQKFVRLLRQTGRGFMPCLCEP